MRPLLAAIGLDEKVVADGHELLGRGDLRMAGEIGVGLDFHLRLVVANQRTLYEAVALAVRMQALFLVLVL